ncbi:MAG: nicotinate (nicotinamide) nucleotide adenylyltransferase [Desulfobacterales bacterium]|jgi:nicotinate-nucleotide adenylyltransferase
MRIGLFGGTFNPIHYGHLNCVAETAEAFDLDQVQLIPAAVPPHKAPGEIIAAHHRLAMVRLAIRDRPHLVVSDLELTREGPSYTVDTIGHYRDRAGDAAHHFLIIGLDSLLEIHTWKSFHRIFTLIPLIVMNRPDTLNPNQGDPLAAIQRYLTSRIDPGYGTPARTYTFEHPRLNPVFYIPVAPQPISATAIRRHIRRGLSLKGLVPPAVDDYIEQQGLYR